MSTLANAGIPMLFWQLPLAAVTFVPIVAVEAWIVRARLERALWPAVSWVAAANALSTFIGVPIAWGAMLAMELAVTGGEAVGFETPWAAFQSVVLSAAWLLPYGGELAWLIPAATLVLLVPYFLVSVALESWVLLWRWRDRLRRDVLWAVFVGNAATYGAFALCAGFQLYRGLVDATT